MNEKEKQCPPLPTIKKAMLPMLGDLYSTYLMTPHLLIRPFSSTTILPDLWSSMYSNSLMYPVML